MPTDVINVIGVGVGVAGIIVGLVWPWYFYLKTVERKDPRCLYRTYKDIVKLSPVGESKIKIHYGSEEVDRVFTTYAWFWNAGKQVIKAEDCRPSRLTLNLSDKSPSFRILDCHVVKRTSENNGLEALKMSATALAIEFDFLNHRDGAVMEIQHTGHCATKITSYGSIIDATDGVKTKPWIQEAPKRDHQSEERAKTAGLRETCLVRRTSFPDRFCALRCCAGALYLIYRLNTAASPAQSCISSTIVILAVGWIIYRVLSNYSDAVPVSLYPA